jgi:hypothetical protein
MDGTADDVGSGMPTAKPGPDPLPVRTLVSPDGTQWIWGQIVSSAGSTVTSTISLGGIGAPPRVVARAVEDQHELRPYRWTAESPLITHGAIGVGGYILFNPPYGQVDQLKLATGELTAIGPADTDAVDVATNGAQAYIELNPGRTARLLTQNGPGLRGLSATLPTTGQAGSLMFDVLSSHLVFCTSPGNLANAAGKEQFETDVIDLNSGARTKFGPPDLRPAMWLPDGRLVEFRGSTDGDGVPGTYLVSRDGAAAKISSYDTVVGFVELPVP